MKIFGSAMSNFCVFNFRRGKAVARGLTAASNSMMQRTVGAVCKSAELRDQSLVGHYSRWYLFSSEVQICATTVAPVCGVT